MKFTTVNAIKIEIWNIRKSLQSNKNINKEINFALDEIEDLYFINKQQEKKLKLPKFDKNELLDLAYDTYLYLNNQIEKINKEEEERKHVKIIDIF
jgi:hypothetical protein